MPNETKVANAVGAAAAAAAFGIAISFQLNSILVF